MTERNSFFLMLDNGLDPDSAWLYNGESLLHVHAHLARAYALIQAGAKVDVRPLSGLED